MSEEYLFSRQMNKEQAIRTSKLMASYFVQIGEPVATRSEDGVYSVFCVLCSGQWNDSDGHVVHLASCVWWRGQALARQIQSVVNDK